MTVVDARLRVVAVGPHVSFQDGGRFGRLRSGVPASGPMDRLAHAAANVAIGNVADATAIEVSLGGLELECVSGAVTMGITGGEFAVEHAGSIGTTWSAITLRAGERLAVRPGAWGSWAYVSACGEMAVPRWLGHTTTHSPSGFGGGALRDGQEFDVVGAGVDTAREGEIPAPPLAMPTGRVRVVMGPQDEHFQDVALSAFRRTPFVLTDAYDRMGVRLRGAPLPLRGALSIPSEPIVRGSVQVAGDGVPTVLLADHQTTGGYPKIATVISADLDRFTQMRAGDTVRFEPVDADTAIEIARAHALDVEHYLEGISEPGRTLAHRLRDVNLISGAVAATIDEPEP